MLRVGFKKLLAQANAEIETISVAEARQLAGRDDVVFVDVREAAERVASGGIASAVHAPRGFLEFHADPESPLHKPALASGKKLVLYCASGGRSALAAKTLKDTGIADVSSLAGGFAAWKEAGGAIEP